LNYGLRACRFDDIELARNPTGSVRSLSQHFPRVIVIQARYFGLDGLAGNTQNSSEFMAASTRPCSSSKSRPGALCASAIYQASVTAASKVKLFTLLLITSRLSCCLKLNSFTVPNLDGAKTRITGGRLNMGLRSAMEILMDKPGASKIRRSEAHRTSVFA
jgi:hypothetical protein